jgi:uncharacterized protein (TIGR01777 family)
LDGADIVINLAGRSVLCRHTSANLRSIANSRVRTTQLVAEAISACLHPPRVWLNASTTDIYRASSNLPIDEFAEIENSDRNFARYWESAVYSVPTPETRKVILRMAPVMTPESNSSFHNLLRLVRLGFGGEIGDGEQFVDWIHDLDFLRAINFLITRDDLQGVINITSPQPVPNHQFMCNLRNAWCTSYFGLPLPAWLVNAACLLVRREPDSLLKSRPVIPRRLLEAGFSFDFPEWRGATENLVDRWRRCHEV